MWQFVLERRCAEWLPWQRPWRNRKKGSRSIIYLPFNEKIVKIGPVYILRLVSTKSLEKDKKREINAAKSYSPFGKFAEQAKLT